MGLQKDALLQTVFRRGLEQGVFLQGVVSRVVMGERYASGFRVVMKRFAAVPGMVLVSGVGLWKGEFSDWWGCTPAVVLSL